VIGFGTMGGGIAMSFATRHPGHRAGGDAAGARQRTGRVPPQLGGQCAEGQDDRAAVEARMALLQPTLRYRDLGTATS